MNTFAQLFTRGFLALAMAASMTLAAQAKGDAPLLVWMAASNSEPSISNEVGRLSMKAGVLSFQSTGQAWQVAVADIKRVALQSDTLMVIETMRDEKYYVAIMGPNMVLQTPRKALDVIQRAQRTPAGGRR